MTKKNNELMHYGVIGMHWGIRRYQPYSTAPRGSGKGGKEIGEAAKVKSRIAKTGKRIDKLASKSVSNKPRSIQRQMNRIEKQTVANAYEARRASERKAAIGTAAGKLGMKAVSRKNGPTERDVKKLEKYTSRANKENTNIKAAQANIKRGESETRKLMARAVKSGYNVSSKETLYFQEKGQLAIASILAGSVNKGAIGYAILTSTDQDNWQKGNKYKVRKK